jgi:hypothetical protein
MPNRKPVPKTGKVKRMKKPLGILWPPNGKERRWILPTPQPAVKAIAPLRPPGWKPRPRYTGKLTLRIVLPEGTRGKHPAAFRIASVHRPRKAGWSHFERTKDLRSAAGAASFEKIPAGEYMVAVRIPGFRPHAEIILHSRKTKSHPIPCPLVRATSPEAERDLLQRGERHPFGEAMRRYLERFGYLRKGACNCPADELCPHLSAALGRFQRRYRLEARGTLTLESFFRGLMPRCSVPDFDPPGWENVNSGPTGDVEGGDPIAFADEHWDSNALTYRFLSGTGDISNEFDILRGALGTWRDHSALTFSEVGAAAESNIEFEFVGASDPDYPFDREGTKHENIYGRGYYPPNGYIAFDDYEDWGDLSLAAVATHEIGHALGLRHSNVEDATMYPWYDPSVASLHEVDVRGIKSLYQRTVSHSGPFVAVPLYGVKLLSGTDSVTIDLGAERNFLAWTTVTMVDSLADFDRDNHYVADIFEIDGVRTASQIHNGPNWGTYECPANVYQGARRGHGRRITFRLSAGHVSDLEVAGYAIVLVLD